MHADPGAVPDQKTLALVNTYIVGVVRVLNEFSCACEQSLGTVQTNLQAAEARLALLEAQLANAEPAAAHAAVDTNTHQPAGDVQEGGSQGASVDTAEADHGTASVPQQGSDWAAGAGEALAAGAEVSAAHDPEYDAQMNGLRL